MHVCTYACVCVCTYTHLSVVTTQPRSLLSQYVCMKYEFAEITHRDRHIFDSSCGNSQGHRSQICSESNQSNEYSTADAHPITARDSGFFFLVGVSLSVPLCLSASVYFLCVFWGFLDFVHRRVTHTSTRCTGTVSINNLAHTDTTQ